MLVEEDRRVLLLASLVLKREVSSKALFKDTGACSENSLLSKEVGGRK